VGEVFFITLDNNKEASHLTEAERATLCTIAFKAKYLDSIFLKL